MPKESADFVRRLAGYIEPARKNHPFASEISLEGAISDVVYSFQLLAEMQGKTTLARNIDEKRKNVLFESIIPELRPTNSKELIDSLERIALENEAILPELIQQTTVDKKATLPPESKFLVVVENSSFDVLNAFHVEMDIALLEPGMNNILGDTARTSLEQGHAATVQISSAITEKGDFQISLRNEQVFLSPSGSEMSGEQMQDISITHLPRSERRSTPLGFMEHIMKVHHGELNYVPAKEGWSEINLTFPARKLAA